MDGVLVDACNLHKVCLEYAMMDEVNYKISDDEHKTRFNGLPTRTKLSILGFNDSLIEKINSRKQQYTLDYIENYIKVDQTKIELLESLKGRYFLACVTNSIHVTAQRMLSKAGILNYFGLVVSSEVAAKPKPAPDPFIYAMKFFNIGYRQTIIVEDSETGLKSAYASKANVIKVSDPSEVNIKLLLEICKY